MYIIKNAFRCIGRSKGRNLLIGIIALVIAVAACIGLSIRQAAVSAKEEAMAGLTVTATISFDRQSMMSEMAQPPANDMNSGEIPDEPEGGFDRSQFAERMGEVSSLTLEEYETYATAETVQDFYYSMTVSANGSDSFLPVTAESEEMDSSGKIDSMEGAEASEGQGFSGGMGGGSKMMMEQSDFQIIGYSSDLAMTSFVEGVATVTEGAVFTTDTAAYDCMISSELATYNDLAVGDTITVTNPDNEEETYDLKVVGIYTDSSANASTFSMGGRGGFSFSDPANQIYMSYNALQAMVDASQTKGDDTALNGSLDATYVFADVEGYNAFETRVRELGLDDFYTVSSQDVTAYENSLVPLETLGTMAGWFLLVILAIGAVILIVLNIFNVRERKYEIGVLTAMGMKKGKVALQFLIEIFAITMVAVIIGVAIGAVSAVPVTNALLENQVASQQEEAQLVDEGFGRPSEMPGGGGNMGSGKGFGSQTPENMPNMQGLEKMIGQQGVEYVSQVNSAMNFTVVLQMMGIAVLLTFISGIASMLFVMRYEPLKILANRD